MRIGIDATCWSNSRGYGRFTRGLVRHLLDSNKADEFILFVDAQTAATHQLPETATHVVVSTSESPTEAASAAGQRSLQDLWAMASQVSRYPLDIFFFPSVYTYFPIFTQAKIILGVHDVIAEDFPELIFPQLKRRYLWQIKGGLARRQADYILTVSNHAKQGILRHFNYPTDRVWVVDEAPDPVFRPLSAREVDSALLQNHQLMAGDRFFLYLGGINPHKNLGTLMTCLSKISREPAHSDMKLVIIGEIEKEVFNPGLTALRQQIQALGLSEQVYFTGYLPDTEAVHFFNAAQAVVLPSFAEGFGLPAMEGAACGTPVIATINSPLPELLSGSGFFIDPHQPDELTDALRQILDNDLLREKFRKGALARSQQFTWQRTARQFKSKLDTLREHYK